MAYRITYGDTEIYDPVHGVSGIHGAKLSQKTDSVAVLEFTATQDNPIVEEYTPHDFGSPMRLYFDDDLLFQGVITRYQTLFNGEMTFRCESDLILLKWIDVMILPNPTGDVVNDRLTAQQVYQRVIDQYNVSVPSPLMKFRAYNASDLSGIGYYDPPSGKTIVDFPTKPTKALDLLSKAILKPYNCFVRVWTEGDERRIAIYNEATSHSTQTIRFGENLLDLVTEIDTENLFTGVFPTGAQRRSYSLVGGKQVKLREASRPMDGYFALRSNTGSTIEAKKGDILVIGDGDYAFIGDETIAVDETGYSAVDTLDIEQLPAGTIGHILDGNTDSTSYTLTIAGLPDGYVQDTQPDRFLKSGRIIWDTNLTEAYGYKTKLYEDSGERYPKRLLSKAMTQLRFNSPAIYGISARGIDMTLYDPSKHHLMVGQTVRVLSEPHGVDTTMIVTGIDLDLDNPPNSRYNLGAPSKSVRSRMEDNASDTEYVMEALQKDIQDTIPASMIRRLF